MVNIRAADCPRALRLLRLEAAQELHTTLDSVSVLEDGAVVDSEEKYRQAISRDANVLTVEATPGTLDPYAALKEGLETHKFSDGLKNAAEAICAGNQKNVQKMELLDTPTLVLNESVVPLLQCLTRLQTLQLCSIILTSKQITDAVRVIPESVVNLHIENVRMDTEALGVLSQRLESLRLKHFVLKNNILEASGLMQLTPGLKQQAELVYLMVEDNGLGSQGCLWLISLLPHLRSLGFLEVRANCFTERDLSHLVRSFSCIPKLRHFAINGNDVTEATSRTVAKYLPDFNMHCQGYYLISQDGPKSASAVKWGRMRNLVMLREVLKKRAHF